MEQLEVFTIHRIPAIVFLKVSWPIMFHVYILNFLKEKSTVLFCVSSWKQNARTARSERTQKINSFAINWLLSATLRLIKKCN